MVMSVRPYGLRAKDSWYDAPEGHALWQIQVTHDVAQPATRDLLRYFAAYLAVLHADNPGTPRTFRDLEVRRHTRFVRTRTDPEHAWIGYKDWRMAIYITAPTVGKIQTFLALWDGFLVYRHRVGRTEGLLDFCMELHIQHDIPVDATAFAYPTYDIFRECLPSQLPHAVTDAWPPAAPGSRSMLKLVLQQYTSESEIIFVLTGNTWTFRDQIRALGGDDYEITEPGSARRSFARVWRVCTIDPALPLSFFGGAVLQEAPVLVYVEDELTPGTPNAALIAAIGRTSSVARVVLPSGA